MAKYIIGFQTLTQQNEIQLPCQLAMMGMVFTKNAALKWVCGQ